MRSQTTYATFALALMSAAAGVSIAGAQTVVARETVTTVRTVHPARRHAAEHVTTTRTVVRERLLPQSTVVAPVPYAAAAERASVAAPAPIYDVVPAPGSRGLYDVVQPPAGQPAAGPFVGVAPAAAGTAPLPGYRYVYEPDRILVIDPYTNIAVQAIPR